MKKVLPLIGVSLAIFVLMGFSAWARGPGYGNSGNNLYDNPLSSTVLMPSQSLSEEEESAILKMREEEKLARDVYLTLRDKWGLLVFDNIAQSEQNHMDMMKDLIQKYDLADPVVDDTVGKFTQSTFTSLYQQLTSTGSQSIIDALKVGATIEDLDIYDLNHELELTDNLDIQNVFKNLRNGSYNHMRSFVGALEAYDETYTPQYISQEELDTILSTQNGHYGGQNSSGSSYVILPGTFKTLSEQEKSNFTLQLSLTVLNKYRGSTAQKYALIHWLDLDKWYLVTAPNTLTEWSSGMELKAFENTTLDSEETEFPIFTNALNLSSLTGIFDVYYGYSVNNDEVVYTVHRLIFE